MIHPDKRRKNKQMLEQTLIPCPFCGMNVAQPTSILDDELCANFEDDELCPNYESYGSDGCGHFVVCNVNKGGCGASTGWYQTIEEAINAWNRRVRS